MTNQVEPILPEGAHFGMALPETWQQDLLVRFISFLPVTFSVVVALFPNILEGQTIEPVYHILSKDMGLKSSTVYCTHVDSRGYLWIGTDIGPVRYDGESFEELPSDRPAINRSSVFHIREDSTGRVWMMTFSGNLYFTRNDSLIYSDLSDIVKAYKGNRWIQDFHIGPDQSLYVPVDFTGILQITQDGQDTLYEARSEELLLKELPNTCLIAFNDSRHHHVPWDSLKCSYTLRILDEEPSIGSSMIIPVVYRYTFGRAKAIPISRSQVFILYHRKLFLFENGMPVRDMTIPQGACALSRSMDGRIVIGYLDQQGLEVYNSVDDVFAGRSQWYFQGYSIGQITWDRHNGCWLSTLENGVIAVPDLSRQILQLPGQALGQYVRSLLVGDGGVLLIGTNNGLIYNWNARNSRLTKMACHPALVSWPTSLTWLEPNRRFLFTIASGTHLGFGDCQTNTLSTMNEPEWNGFMNVGPKRIRDVTGKRCVILSGTYGFMRYDPMDRCAIWSSRILDNERANDAVESPDGRIWVARLDGLYQLTRHRLVPVPFDHPSLRSSIRNLLWSERKQALIYATMDGELGLIRGDSLTVLSTVDGLLHSPIWEVYEDQNGDLWTATNEGVNVVRIQTQGVPQILALRKAEGLPSLEVTSLAETSSHIVIGTAGGILFYPKNSPVHPCPVPVIRQVTVNQLPVLTTNLYRLSSTENSLAFQYVSVDPSRLGNLTYRYRLDPSQAWVLTTETEVLFLQLRPADYAFEVQAKASDSSWSDSLVLPFSIPPPFWQRWWFISLAAIGLAGATGWGVQWRNRLAQKEGNLRKEMDQLERAALKAQMNPHFIFNCLNSIQNLLARDDKSGAMTYLVHFATLIRKILYFSDSRTISLDDEVRMLESYLALEQLRFRQTLSYRIEVDPSLDSEEVFIPPLMVQPFVENAIKHGIANLQGEGVVMVRFSPGASDFLHVEIEDNGIGIQEHQKATERRGSPSVGIAKTRRRLGLLTDNEQQIEIRTVKDEYGKAMGTLVSLDLPVSQSHFNKR